MTAGVSYAIVVDGYGGKFGQYQIDMVAEQVAVTRCCSFLPHQLSERSFEHKEQSQDYMLAADWLRFVHVQGQLKL